MKKCMVSVAAALVLVCMFVLPAMAGKGGSKGFTQQSYLYEKDPVTWEIVDGGAWGKLSSNAAGETFAFTFTGHGLVGGESYTLMYYPDPWPGNGLICLGAGVANNGSQVQISGDVDTGDLPADYDANVELGAKIWLVLSSDVDCEGGMVGWNPGEYLFEYDMITFDAK